MRRFLKVMKAAGDLMVADTQMAAKPSRPWCPRPDVAVDQAPGPTPPFR